MLDHKYFRIILITACLLVFAIAGCGSQESKTGNVQTDAQKTEIQQSETTPPLPATSAVTQAEGAGIAIDVDGSKLTKEQLESEIKRKIEMIKKQVPANRQQQVRDNVRKQVLTDFTVRTLLTNEVNRLNISVNDKEVTEATERLKKSLPQGMTIEDLMKKNKIDKAKMQEEIRFGIKINKLVLSQSSGKTKPKEKEITAFYQKNKDKFKMPESVHVRHILVASATGDDDKIKTEKKAKAEDLRKQLLAGANFAELAKKSSDCPSKESGGDLGVFRRGEMVKQFEDAAFAQDVNTIGPVVETQFGYHIIQVLEKYAPKTLPLDEKMKSNISSFIEQQKQQEVFDSIVKKLRAKANIVVYPN